MTFDKLKQWLAGKVRANRSAGILYLRHIACGDRVTDRFMDTDSSVRYHSLLNKLERAHAWLEKRGK